MNPDRKVQMIVASVDELIASTCTTRRLLVVPVYRTVKRLFYDSLHKHVDSSMCHMSALPLAKP